MNRAEEAHEALQHEIENLRARLQETEETLRAVRSGEATALVVSGPQGERVYTLKGVDRPHRAVIEEINEAAAALTADGTIRYANSRFAAMLRAPLEEVIGSAVDRFVETTDRQTAHALLQQGRRGTAEGKLTLLAEDGARVPAVVFISPLQMEDVSVVCVAVTDPAEQQRQEEITEPKRAGHALRQSEETARALLNAASETAILLDREGTILAINNIAAERLNRSVEELIGKSVYDVLPPDVGRFRRARADEVIRSGEPVRFEDEREGMVYANAAFPVLDAEGNVTRFAVFARDVTAQKQAERHRELTGRILERLNQPGEGHDVIADVLTLIKDSVDVEATGLRLREGEDFPYFVTSGFPADFVEAETYLCARGPDGETIRDPKGRPYLECMCGNILSGRTDPAAPFFTEGGSFWTNSTSELLASTTEEDRVARTRNRCNTAGYESVALIPLRSGEEIIGLLQLNDKRRDRFTLTMIESLEQLAATIGVAVRRQRAEEALRESEQRYRYIFEQSPVGIGMTSPEGEVVTANDAMQAITGYSLEDLQKMNLAEAYDDPQDRKALVEAVQRSGGVVDFPVRLKRKDGTRFDALLSTTKMKLGGRDFYQTICQDVTERKRAEEALRDSEERFRRIAETVQDVFWISRPGVTGVIYVSPAYEKIWGRTCESLYESPRSCLEAIHPEDRERVMAGFREHARGKWDLEYRIVRPDGSVRWVRDRGFPVRDREGNLLHMTGVATDITVQKDYEEQLLALNRTLEDRVAEGTAFMKLLQDTADIANEAMSADQAFRAVLGRLRDHLGWAVGHAWSIEITDGEAFVETGLWSLKSPRRLKRFVKGVSGTQFEPARCFLGRVGATGKPAWITDITKDPDCARCKAAGDLGARACLAFPVLVGERPVAVMELFAEQAAEPDEDLLQVAAHVGAQLGQVVERQSLQEQLIDTVWREQRQFGQELHDGLCQQIAGIAMLAGGLKQRLQAEGAAEADVAADLSKASQQAAEQLSGLVRSLFPVEVDAEALKDALEQMTANTETLYGVDCALRYDTSVFLPDDTTAAHLFRICQEAVNNAVQHGRAKTVAVTLQGERGGLTLEVRDDGVGVDPAELARARGMGLRIMRHRAQVIGAALEIGPADGGGTVVRCRLEDRAGDR